MNEIDKAELIQGLKAFLVPSSLFVACLLGAAGVFLIREGYGVGWAFVASSVVIIVSAFAAFITFQNKLRNAGHMVDPHDEQVADYSSDENSDPHSASDASVPAASGSQAQSMPANASISSEDSRGERVETTLQAKA